MEAPYSDATSTRQSALRWPIRLRRDLVRRALWAACAAGTLVALGTAIAHEFRTSALTSRVLAAVDARLSFEVGRGASPRIAFPRSGPFDIRHGYTRLPDFTERLGAGGFRIEEQARFSPALARLVALGLEPPYHEPAARGLVIRAVDGQVLRDAVRHDLAFAAFEDIPALVTRTLAHMEDRELLHPADPRANPAVDWARLAKASLLYGGARLGLGLPIQGGSTLATQLEKFRHAPAGRTYSAPDKLRQMATASLRAYRGGADTTAWRQRVLVDYLNAMPLAAAPGFGEVHGIGSGLEAWFGLSLAGVRGILADPDAPLPTVAHAYKHVLALLAALPAPSRFLRTDRAALERRIDGFLRLLTRDRVIDQALADATRRVQLEFRHRATPTPQNFVDAKATAGVRARLLDLLGVRGLYTLDRLDLAVDTTIDAGLESDTGAALQRITDPAFVRARGLASDERVLQHGDPANVVYSVLLYERTAGGNLLRVRADTLDRPFDLNSGAKLELGSTAKLRTLAHYLEVVALLFHHATALDDAGRAAFARDARDPITRWVAAAMAQDPAQSLDTLLDAALARRYSAAPGEVFFTGNGAHTFSNFDDVHDGSRLTVREGLRHSVNLLFIRLMRDLVAFHRARLPYDADAVVRDVRYPLRRALLDAVAADEAEQIFETMTHRYRGRSPAEAIARLLGRHHRSPRRLAALFYAWHPGGSEIALGEWLTRWVGPLPAERVASLARAYGAPGLTIADFGYLLSRPPLEVWCASELQRDPKASSKDLRARSAAVQRLASAWLFAPRNRRAQNLRLRIRIERDAFARMTPDWQRLGFPFERLVPTYATAIGSSGDRPAALAALMGIIANDGLRLPMRELTRLHFARGTPYETVAELAPAPGERVMDVAVARALRGVLAEVVEGGTARRLRGAFVSTDGTAVVVGGKTGTGDNRLRGGRMAQAGHTGRARNRTATFVFYVGDRFFGVVTAIVPGEQAAAYRFTSALPVEVLKLLAPAVNRRL